MHTLGTARWIDWVKLLKAGGTVFFKIGFMLLIAGGLVAAVVYYSLLNRSNGPTNEFLAQEYSALVVLEEEIYILERDAGICHESLTYLAMKNRNTPEFLWPKKHLLERNRLETRYWKLRSKYHELALEYNQRHSALGYRFIYYEKLPEGATETLPKYYIPLE